MPQFLWPAVRGHPSANRGAVGQLPADLFDGRHHQCRDPAVEKMGGRLVPRLVVVSNRVAVPDPEGPRAAGGLAVAVNAALKHREGLWFGWSGKIKDDTG